MPGKLLGVIVAGQSRITGEKRISSQLALRRFLFRVNLILRIRSLEIFDAAVLEMPDACGNLIDHIVIVRHQQHRPKIFLQRNIQRVDRFEV